MADRRELPPLDLLLGFEAAARHLSFTKAAGELFLTQSAVSRQVQALEEALGVPLFQRKHRALLLTDEGQMLLRSTSTMLDQMRELTRKIRGSSVSTSLSVTTVISFASLWLIRRLPKFRELNPCVDVRISADNQLVDLTRDRVDVAIRYCPPDAAPKGAVRLFGEDVMPVCSPALLRDKKKPLKAPADLKHHVLLHDDYSPREPWLHWDTWLQAHGAGLQRAGDVGFSHYDQMIQAAVEGQGVALGRWPLLSGLLKRRQLVAPFDPATLHGDPPKAPRAFFVFCEPRTASRPEVKAFVDWLIAESDRDCGEFQPPAAGARSGKRSKMSQ